MVSPATLFKNASNIHDDIINEIYFSDDMIQIEIESPSGSSNVVTVDENGNWNCYYFSHNKVPGEYCCKHILAAINYIFNKRGLYE